MEAVAAHVDGLVGVVAVIGRGQVAAFERTLDVVGPSTEQAVAGPLGQSQGPLGAFGCRGARGGAAGDDHLLRRVAKGRSEAGGRIPRVAIGFGFDTDFLGRASHPHAAVAVGAIQTAVAGIGAIARCDEQTIGIATVGAAAGAADVAVEAKASRAAGVRHAIVVAAAAAGAALLARLVHRLAAQSRGAVAVAGAEFKFAQHACRAAAAADGTGPVGDGVAAGGRVATAVGAAAVAGAARTG